MAERWAVATGNANATATWNGGTLPEVDDDVYANGFTVTVNVDTHWKNAYTLAGTTAVAGGGFTLSNGVTLTLNNGNGYAVAGSSNCITYSGTTGNSATLIGNPAGSSTTNTRYGAVNASLGTLNIIGNPIGGSRTSAVGAVNNSIGRINVIGSPIGGTGATNANGCQNIVGGIITVHGDCVGGSVSSSVGVANTGSGTTTIHGDATGGTNATAYGASNTSNGTLTVNGKAISNVAAGVNGSVIGTTSIAAAETGIGRIFPYVGKVAFINLSTATLGVRDSNGTLKTLKVGGSNLTIFKQKVIQ